jgi:hypothetical protein
LQGEHTNIRNSDTTAQEKQKNRRKINQFRVLKLKQELLKRSVSLRPSFAALAGKARDHVEVTCVPSRNLKAGRFEDRGII